MSKKFSALILCVIIILYGFPICVHGADSPSLSAKSGVLINAADNSVIFSHNCNEKLPMASTTKIMTALVTLEHSSLNKVVKISDDAIGVEGTSLYLKKGEKLTVSDLLYAVLLQSANDAAAALAIYVAGSVEGFASLMNQKAEMLGLKSTHFNNPHGLDDDEHYTTAYELALISSAAMKNPEFRKIVSTVKQQISVDGSPVTIVNHNRLLREYDGCIGVKTGYTKRCGRCLVSAAERDGLTLIAVTLSAPDDWNDHKKMLDYGFSKFINVKLAGQNGIIIEVPVAGTNGKYIKTVSPKNLNICLPANYEEIKIEIELPKFVFSPVKKDSVIGKITFLNGNTEIMTSPMMVAESYVDNYG